MKNTKKSVKVEITLKDIMDAEMYGAPIFEHNPAMAEEKRHCH
jgi:hypothetical protein